MECSEWMTKFEEMADFGWDYFQAMQKASSDESDISWGGACRFHDHSDIFGWKQEVHGECPFLDGPQHLIHGQNMVVLPSVEYKVPEKALVLGDETPLQVDRTPEDEGF